MNNRLENGHMDLRTKQLIVDTLQKWVREEDVEIEDDAKAYYFDNIKDAEPEGKDQYISYWSDYNERERKIYFPETDSVNRIKKALIIDEKVKEYVEPDAVADFIYNCIDVNALACVQHIALLYDEPILDEDGEIEDWEETKGRQELMDRITNGCDEYAMEVGLELLGVVWEENSAVILNISQIVEGAKESAKEIAIDYYDDVNEWPKLFQREFEIALISTICHEFRHAVYELNDYILRDGSDERYPEYGSKEADVEEYGNRECESLRLNMKALPYIEKMINIDVRSLDKSMDRDITDDDLRDIYRDM